MIHRLLDLETAVLDRGGALLKEISTASSRKAAFRDALRDELLGVCAGIQALAAATEKQTPRLTAEDAAVALGSLGRVFHTWDDLNQALARVADLARLGKLEGGYEGLAAAATGENLEERLGLAPLRETLRGIAASAAPPRNGNSAAPLPAARDPYPVCLDSPPEALELGLIAEPPRREPHTAPGLDYPFPLSGAEMEAQFESRVKALLSQDELESHAAFIELLDRNRDALIVWLFKGISQENADVAATLRVFARHADLVLVADSFSRENMKLFQLLANATRYAETAIFQKLVNLFRVRSDGQPNSSDLLSLERHANEETRAVVLRALLLHPLSVYRRYALSQLLPREFWPIVSYPLVPLVPLVDLYDRIALEDVTSDYRKVFFDCTLDSIARAQGELELRAARRILHRLVGFDFFMEDRYYEKLSKLNETLLAEETRLGLENWLARRSMELLRERKAKAGPHTGRPPASLVEIPLLIQRKLARHGTYLHVFLRHPDPRIALETLRWIDTPAKAEAVLKLPALNRALLVRLAEREHLLVSRTARVALLAHPGASIEAARKVAPHVSPEDLERVTTLKGANPEVVRFLREQLGRLRQTSAQV